MDGKAKPMPLDFWTADSDFPWRTIAMKSTKQTSKHAFPTTHFNWLRFWQQLDLGWWKGHLWIWTSHPGLGILLQLTTGDISHGTLKQSYRLIICQILFLCLFLKVLNISFWFMTKISSYWTPTPLVLQHRSMNLTEVQCKTTIKNLFWSNIKDWT